MNKTTTFLNLEINDYIRELLIYQVQLKNQGKNYSADSNILLIENKNFQENADDYYVENFNNILSKSK